VVRIFPDVAICLPLVRALAVGPMTTGWKAIRYLNMDHFKQHKKAALRAPHNWLRTRPARGWRRARGRRDRCAPAPPVACGQS
jgi:hypothetical protein